MGPGGWSDINDPQTKQSPWTGVSIQPTGHKGQLAPRCCALDAMITKFYPGIQQNAVHPFRFKNFEHLGFGGGELLFNTQL